MFMCQNFVFVFQIARWGKKMWRWCEMKFYDVLGKSGRPFKPLPLVLFLFPLSLVYKTQIKHPWQDNRPKPLKSFSQTPKKKKNKYTELHIQRPEQRHTHTQYTIVYKASRAGQVVNGSRVPSTMSCTPYTYFNFAFPIRNSHFTSLFFSDSRRSQINRSRQSLMSQLMLSISLIGNHRFHYINQS